MFILAHVFKDFKLWLLDSIVLQPLMQYFIMPTDVMEEVCLFHVNQKTKIENEKVREERRKGQRKKSIGILVYLLKS